MNLLKRERDEDWQAKCFACRIIFDEYIRNPRSIVKRALEVAYENIPEKDRVVMFGDMDVNDIPVRIVLYGEDSIEDKIRLSLSKQRIDDYLAGKIPLNITTE